MTVQNLEFIRYKHPNRQAKFIYRFLLYALITQIVNIKVNRIKSELFVLRGPYICKDKGFQWIFRLQLKKKIRPLTLIAQVPEFFLSQERSEK